MHRIVTILRAVPVLALVLKTYAQQIGRTPEVHPKLTTYKCSGHQECQAQNTSLVLDYLWRNVQDISTGQSCLTESLELNKTICPTQADCAKHCALEGANYTETGIEVSDDSHSVTLQMFHHIDGAFVQVAPQVYLLDEATQDYVLLKLLGQEVSFDVDVSKAPCGVDAALYLTGMDASGGRSQLNPAGASYGTGYCDSQCDDTYPFINGVANIHKLGTCCNELDLWEANSRATQLTAHPCNVTGLFACSGKECDWHDGVCDRSGCDFQPYAFGDHDFYGLHKTVDTTKPFRVVTQFPVDSDGELNDIRRLYIQDGKLIQNAEISTGKSNFSSLSTDFCDANFPHFAGHGGLPLMGKALDHGMVAVFGLWNDPGDFNNWLDSNGAGPCSKSQGKPSNIKHNHPGTSITFSNLRWGEIGSTYGS